jgi:hypothetical protein
MYGGAALLCRRLPSSGRRIVNEGARSSFLSVARRLNFLSDDGWRKSGVFCRFSVEGGLGRRLISDCGFTLAYGRSCDEISATASTRIECGKGQGAMWRELVALGFLVLLLGVALMANVTDGPMPEQRGSWLTYASK